MISNYIYINDDKMIDDANVDFNRIFLINKDVTDIQKLIINGLEIIEVMNETPEILNRQPILLNKVYEKSINLKNKFNDKTLFDKFQNTMNKEAVKLQYNEKREQYKLNMKKITSLTSSRSSNSSKKKI